MKARAERRALDRALDEVVAGRPVDTPAPLGDLAAVAARLRAAAGARVSPAVAERHLLLMNEAARERATAAPAPPRRPAGRRVAIVLAATMLLALGASQVGFAASDALPGDLLYPVKRAVERLNLAVHPGAVSRATIHLELAERRLTELAALVDRGDDRERIDAAASAYRAQSQTAVDELGRAQDAGLDIEALVARVDGRLAAHIEHLVGVHEWVPEPARPAIGHAIERMTEARERLVARLGDHPGRGRGPHVGSPNGDPGPPLDVPGNGSPGPPGSAPPRS